MSIYYWVISADADNPSSAFYVAQTGTYNASTNPTGFILGSVLQADITRHESGNVNSHYANYISAVPVPANNLGIQLEAITTFGGSISLLAQNTSAQVDANLFAAASPEPCGHEEANYSRACVFDGNINFTY